MAAWLTVAPGVHQRRYDPFDISIVAIEGDDGLLLVDTRVEPREGEALLADLRERFEQPVRWVVNTHAHFDHTFGNQVFGPGTATDAAIYGHANIARHFGDFEGPRLAAWREDPRREPDRHWADVRLTPPTHPLDRATTLDLGSRVVELRPSPRRTPTPTSWCSSRSSGCGSSATSSRSPARSCTAPAASPSGGPTCSTRWRPKWRKATQSCPVTGRSSTASSSPARPVS